MDQNLNCYGSDNLEQLSPHRSGNNKAGSKQVMNETSPHNDLAESKGSHTLMTIEQQVSSNQRQNPWFEGEAEEDSQLQYKRTEA